MKRTRTRCPPIPDNSGHSEAVTSGPSSDKNKSSTASGSVNRKTFSFFSTNRPSSSKPRPAQAEPDSDSASAYSLCSSHSLTDDNSDISTKVRLHKSRRASSSSQQRRGGRSSGGSAEGRKVAKRKKDDEDNGVVGKGGGYLKRVKRQGYEEYQKRTLKDVSLTPTLEPLKKGLRVRVKLTCSGHISFSLSQRSTSSGSGSVCRRVGPEQRG